MDKITFIDGTAEEQTEALKEFFGLSPDQTLQDIDVDENEDENE